MPACPPNAGVDITSASTASDDATVVQSGTSMAAPMVAGAIALLMERNTSLTPPELKPELEVRCRFTQLCLPATVTALVAHTSV
jgi:serine protease AprX